MCNLKLAVIALLQERMVWYHCHHGNVCVWKQMKLRSDECELIMSCPGPDMGNMSTFSVCPSDHESYSLRILELPAILNLNSVPRQDVARRYQFPFMAFSCFSNPSSLKGLF